MDITIYPGKLSGKITAVSSKSFAHRILICASFADRETRINCNCINDDIAATIRCMNALGAQITVEPGSILVQPIKTLNENVSLYCGESGSTLRFLLPIVGALGVDASFHMEGRLPNRPLSPLWELLENFGCTLTRPSSSTIQCTGKLQPGNYTIDSSVSSQFISGLMFAHFLMDGTFTLNLTGKQVSKPYVEMTETVLKSFGITDHSKKMRSCGSYTVEGDWSNGAFFVAANTLESNVTIEGLESPSVQGDSVFPSLASILKQEFATIDATNIPDLVPILSMIAACNHGAKFTSVSRLRLKESDRIAAISNMLSALGIPVVTEDDSITVRSGKLLGGTVDSCKDHRIAMAAAIGATVAQAPVTILDADCVNKSYPSFWEEFARLGGNYEQYLR